MPVELKGQQLRIRIRDQKLFKPKSFRSKKVKDGKVQLIFGHLKKNDKFTVQSVRLNLSQINGHSQHTTKLMAYDLFYSIAKRFKLSSTTVRDGLGLIASYY